MYSARFALLCSAKIGCTSGIKINAVYFVFRSVCTIFAQKNQRSMKPPVHPHLQCGCREPRVYNAHSNAKPHFKCSHSTEHLTILFIQFIRAGIPKPALFISQYMQLAAMADAASYVIRCSCLQWAMQLAA